MNYYIVFNYNIQWQIIKDNFIYAILTTKYFTTKSQFILF